MVARFRSPSGLFRITSLLCLALLLGASGCSSKKVKSLVSGKVTSGQKPVQGTIIFVGPDNKETASPITGGSYSVANLPNGKYKVAIRGMNPLGGGPAPVPKDGSGALVGGAGGGVQTVEPPAKYADANKSGLEFEVTGGEQTFDIPL